LEGALNGIFLLHETYDLNLTAFSLGLIEVPGQPGAYFQTSHQLNAKDLVRIFPTISNLSFYFSDNLSVGTVRSFGL